MKFFYFFLILLLIACVEEQNSSTNISTKSKGELLYETNCLVCHMSNGEGIPGFFPPLSNSDYMLEDIDRTIKTILYGSESPIIVNGISYPGSTMNQFDHLSNEDIAFVSTYILNAWGNDMGIVYPEMVDSNR